MSICTRDERKLILHQDNLNPLREVYKMDPQREHKRWRDIAIFTLRHSCDWEIDHLATAFDMHKGTISRRLACAENELKEAFELLRENDYAGAPA